MQLRMARLCLDCEEVHDAQQCPICTSESFAYLSRWIPIPERRARPRPPVGDSSVDLDRVEAIKRLTGKRVLAGSMVGMTALGVIGWFWNRGPGGETAAPDRTRSSGHASGKVEGEPSED